MLPNTDDIFAAAAFNLSVGVVDPGWEQILGINVLSPDDEIYQKANLYPPGQANR